VKTEYKGTQYETTVVEVGDTVMVEWAGNSAFRDGPYEVADVDYGFSVDIPFDDVVATVPLGWVEVVPF
jgi:hypothetical protein